MGGTEKEREGERRRRLGKIGRREQNREMQEKGGRGGNIVRMKREENGRLGNKRER